MLGRLFMVRFAQEEDVIYYGETPGHERQRLVAALGLLTWLSLPFAPAPALGAPTTRDVLEGTQLGLEVDDLVQGQTATVIASEIGVREMGVVLGCLLPPGKSGSLSAYRSAEVIMPPKYRDLSGPIDMADIEGSLEALVIGSESEAERYLAAEPGWDLSLSSEEIARFRALASEDAGLAEVETLLRAIFAERIRAYAAKGLAGIAPFDRGDGESSSVADDLRRSTAQMDGLNRVLPELYATLKAEPRVIPEGAEEFYFWSRIKVLGRPVFMLHHRFWSEIKGSSVVVERQYYATQFLGAGQTITALIPVAEGTLFLYVDHTFVDRWTGAGFTKGAKKRLGREIVEGVLEQMSEQLELCPNH